MASQGHKRKDLALTTLIDLLVQIIFVLAFVIVIGKAVVSAATPEPDYKELWRHLVESIFDSIGKSDPQKQTDAAVAEVKRLKTEVKRLTEQLNECETKLGACQKELDKGKGSGLPACEMGLPMFQVMVTRDGKVSVSATEPGAKELSKLGVVGLTLETPLNGTEFGSMFSRIKQRQPGCRYRVTVSCEDRNLPAGDYEANLRVIMGLFSTPSSQRTCR